jgi:outer membrane protein insertion porin family/translocation and assembly module TamA
MQSANRLTRACGTRFRRLTHATAALLLLCSCATPEAAEEPAVSPARVEELVLEGGEAIPRKEVLGYLLTEPPTWKPWRRQPPFDQVTLEADMRRIRMLYRRAGYYEARARYELDWDESRTRVGIRIVVTEGDPVLVRDLQIDLGSLARGQGDTQTPILTELGLEVGDRFDLSKYAAAKQRLLERLADAGYPLREITGGADVDVSTHSARVRWQIEPGPEIWFGPVQVTGLERVEEAFVRREVTLREGDRFSRKALAATQRAVYDLGLFRSVIVEPHPTKTPEPTQPQSPEAPSAPEIAWPVEVKIVERPPRSIQIGVGYGTEEQVRARVAWQHRNFLGAARKLGLQARYSSLLAGLEGSVRQRRFLHPQVSLTLAADAQRETLTSYDADRVRFRTELSRPFGKLWNGRVGHAFEWNDVSDVSLSTDEILDDPEDTFLLSYLETGLTRTTVNDPTDPKEGSVLDFGLQFSPGFLGSDFNYAKMVVEGRRFVRLWDTVLALRLRLGTIQPFGGNQSEEVPLVARFFSGGSNSVRGFDYQELGPLDAAGNPVGGTSLAGGSVELRFPIWRQLGGVVFLDGGEVDLDPFTWRLQDMFYSVGTGVRYRTPLGPLRLDLGYVLNPEDEIDRFRVHFSVGHAF